MYQPYIRGKQFELIGLRELTEDGLLIENYKKVSPIIEPVRDSSTLKSTLEKFVENEINFTLIVNPQVGPFREIEKIFSIISKVIPEGYDNYQIGIIFHRKINHSEAIEFLAQYKSLIPFFSIIHNSVFDNVEDILKKYGTVAPIKYNVINLSSTTRRYHRNFKNETLIELDDYFNKLSKNADYLSVEDSFFSEEHLYYKEEGFEGFSDFLSIGEEYSDSGFLPYAVSIHLSYTDNERRIRIKHFVSHSNDDNSDVAGKFAEALEKLMAWCDETGFNSIVVPIFRDYYKDGHFPGLGTLKKLSLMNHIDVVLKLI